MPNTTIESAKFNQVVDDFVQDANNPRPISAGGTGGNSIASAQSNLQVDQRAVYSAKAANYTAVAGDNNGYLRFTAAATLAMTAAATLGTNWHALVIAEGGDVVIDPSASETINGAATLIVKKGQSAFVICDGSAFFAVITPANDNIPDFLSGLITSKSSSYVISVGVGSIKGNGIVVTNTGALTKNLNAAWAAGSGNGGRLSAAAVAANTTYHLHALRKDSDGSFEWGYDVSATAPTVPAGYSWVGRFDWCYTNATPNAIVDYVQVDSKKLFPRLVWFTTNTNIADGVSTLPATVPLPAGIRTEVELTVGSTANAGGSFDVYVNDGDSSVANAGPIALIAAAATTTSINIGGGGKIRSNLTRQLRLQVASGGTGGATTVYASNVLDYTLNRVY